MGGVDGTAILKITGIADIQTITAIHQNLREAVESREAVVVDLQHLEEFDITFIQLMEAARHQSARSGKEFRLGAPATGVLREALERGGFLACAADQAFWLHATGEK